MCIRDRHDGVFGLWYGKGPGVDRSGDALRHANLAGTSKFGGVVMVMGDDHTGESSTTLHQSDYGLIDSMIPIFSPSGVQEIIDYSIYGWSLSRFAGVWAGLKCIKDTVEVKEIVNVDSEFIEICEETNLDQAGKFEIQLNDTPIQQEERLHYQKLPAVKFFVRKKTKIFHSGSYREKQISFSGWQDLMAIKISEGGFLSLLQDRGRFGHHRIGLTTGGAMDQNAYRICNKLLGNPDDTAVI